MFKRSTVCQTHRLPEMSVAINSVVVWTKAGQWKEAEWYWI